MRPAKWVYSIECRGDGCFICILPFLVQWQIFLFFLDWCPMVFRIGPRPSQGRDSILVVLRYYSLLWLVVSCYFRPENLLSILFEVCSSDIGLLSFFLVLGFSSSHRLEGRISFEVQNDNWSIFFFLIITLIKFKSCNFPPLYLSLEQVVFFFLLLLTPFAINC